MPKKYRPMLFIVLVTLLLVIAVIGWFNRKIGHIEQEMREYPAYTSPATP